MTEPSPARALAARVLERAREGERFAGDELERALRGGALSREDRALATVLVYGAIRHQGTIDWLLARLARLKPARTDARVLDHIRLAAYQMLYCERIPAFAAVNDAVALVGRTGGRRAMGFANAVLRALGRALAEGAVAASGSPRRDLPRGNGRCAVFAADVLPDPKKDPALHLAVTLSQPMWLVERWLRRFGRERAEAVARASLVPPPLTLRVNRLRAKREDVLARIPDAEAGADAWAIRVRSVGAISQIPGYEDGQFSVQDETSMRVAPLLAPRPGGAYVDLCAAPGGKATHLAECMGDQGLVMALDPTLARLEKVAGGARRLGLTSVRAVCADGRRPPLSSQRRWDGVLLDAPCSNTGVLARRVEARWRLEPADIAALAALQLELLVGAATLLPVGGRLTYSTCSIEPEENEDQIARFVTGMAGAFRLISQETAWPAPEASGGFLALLERVG